MMKQSTLMLAALAALSLTAAPALALYDESRVPIRVIATEDDTIDVSRMGATQSSGQTSPNSFSTQNQHIDLLQNPVINNQGDVAFTASFNPPLLTGIFYPFVASVRDGVLTAEGAGSGNFLANSSGIEGAPAIDERGRVVWNANDQNFMTAFRRETDGTLTTLAVENANFPDEFGMRIIDVEVGIGKNDEVLINAEGFNGASAGTRAVLVATDATGPSTRLGSRFDTVPVLRSDKTPLTFTNEGFASGVATNRRGDFAFLMNNNRVSPTRDLYVQYDGEALPRLVLANGDPMPDIGGTANINANGQVSINDDGVVGFYNNGDLLTYDPNKGPDGTLAHVVSTNLPLSLVENSTASEPLLSAGEIIIDQRRFHVGMDGLVVFAARTRALSLGINPSFGDNDALLVAQPDGPVREILRRGDIIDLRGQAVEVTQVQVVEAFDRAINDKNEFAFAIRYLEVGSTTGLTETAIITMNISELVEPVPTPATAVLLLAGLAGLRRR